MQCPSCGTLLGPADRYCPSCGAPVTAQTSSAAPQSPAAFPSGQPYTAPDYASLPNPALAPENRDISKDLYFKTIASDKVRKGITSSAVVCYVCAAITGLVSLLLLDSPMMLIDVIFLLVLGVLIHVKQSRVCAVILMVYSLINCVVSTIQTGSLGGWLVVLAGVYAVKNTFALEKEYKAWRSGGKG